MHCRENKLSVIFRHLFDVHFSDYIQSVLKEYINATGYEYT